MEVKLAVDQVTQRIKGMAFMSDTFEEERMLGLFLEALNLDTTDIILEHGSVPFATFRIEKIQTRRSEE